MQFQTTFGNNYLFGYRCNAEAKATRCNLAALRKDVIEQVLRI
jgi:hypothetical protein